MAGVAMVDVKAIAGIRDTKVLTHYYCHATRVPRFARDQFALMTYVALRAP